MKKRILCLLLALTLLLSDAPLVSLATEIYDETQPVVTELPEQELSATEPSVTEPPVSEPPVTEPPVTEPATTEPEETQPEHIHTYTCEVFEPDCIAWGFSNYTCSCGDTYTDAYTDPLGHEFGDDNLCVRCGEGIPVPPAPVITAENDPETGHVTLHWDAVAYAYCYAVYRSDSKKGEYELLDYVMEPEYEDLDGEPGKRYYYRVQAANDDLVFSEASKVVYRTCDLAAPAVTASNDPATGKVTLSWKKIPGAVSYKVYRSEEPNGEYRLVFRTEGNTYTNSSGVAGVSYYYKVAAVAANTSANSALSKRVYRTCDLPATVVTAANVESSGKVRLTWEAVEGAVSYQIYRAEKRKGDYKLMFTTDGTSYTNGSGDVGKTYYYKVKALAENKNANSAFSEVVFRTRDLPRPKITKAENLDYSGKIKLTWDAVEGAVAYRIYRSDAEDGTYELLLTTKGTTFINGTAEAGKTYFYKIRAVAENTNANSALSVARKRTCDCLAPEIKVINNEKGKPRVQWEAVEGAVTYKVYRGTSADGPFKLVFTTDQLQYNNTSAELGRTYYYKVRAIGPDSSSTSPDSNIASGAAIRNVYQYVYSSYSTTKYGSWGRNTNLTLACKAINGTVLEPGEEFSFNGIVGPRTEKKGYQMATVFNDIGEGRGGGVCQVATTLFNCALIGNLKISYRRQHSQAVTYVPLGRDATVYKKIKDFRFINNTDYCIKIQSKSANGTVNISFLTREKGVSPKADVTLTVTEEGGVYILTRRYQGKVNYTTRSTYTTIPSSMLR